MAARGFGKAGFCKICAHPAADVFVQGAREGWNAARANEEAAKYQFSFNRQTWYLHRDHAKTTEQRVIQRAVAVRNEGQAAITTRDIKKSSNTEFLEAVRDLGMQRALENPDEVSVDQALKAVQVLEARQKKGGDQLNVLVAFMTGHEKPVVVVEGVAPVIEGTAEEIPTE